MPTKCDMTEIRGIGNDAMILGCKENLGNRGQWHLDRSSWGEGVARWVGPWLGERVPTCGGGGVEVRTRIWIKAGREHNPHPPPAVGPG